MKRILLVCTLFGLFSACTEGGALRKDKKYTPVYLYYNPFEPTEEVTGSMYSPDKDYPNYLNYPNDCAKHGLRGLVDLVSYIGRGIAYSELNFDKEGKLMSTVNSLDAAKQFAEFRDFKYNSMGKLIEIYRKGSSIQKLEYDTSGKCIKRDIGYAYQTYTYYDNGTLKEITPQIYNDYYLDHGFYGKMEFNEAGELVKANFMTTSNPFFGDGKSSFRSLCTFSYASNGLCTQKNETAYPKKAHSEVDSIYFHNAYAYNDKGDIARWEYSETFYQQSVSQSGKNHTFLFEYKYDRHDNWTTMKIILPNYFIGNRKALADFASEHYILGQLFMGVKELNDPASITIERQIRYHALPAASESKVSSPQMEIKPDAPRFTAVQGHGLYGKVKSVFDGACTDLIPRAPLLIPFY